MGPNPMPGMKNLVLKVKKNHGVKGIVIMGYETRENLTHVNGTFI
jgi:hypothetical protein